MLSAVPRRKRKLPPLDLGGESPGQRLARIRKERGYSQVELAERIGLTQTLVSDYECGRLRLNADTLARFALTLEVSSDEIIGLRPVRSNGGPKSRKLQRRLASLEDLPKRDQELLLRTIDTFLRAAAQ
jgi:transcriptional regulator with XRE-family HTH domain